MNRNRLTTLALLCSIAGVASASYLIWHGNPRPTWPRLRLGPLHQQRPYGMAPVAFAAYMRACYRAGVSSDRIGQTIGNHPLSVGYHLRDGVLHIHAADYDYTAATDIDARDLTNAQIRRFQQELARQGFANWYRHDGKWTGDEHLHAVYALLPMKPQLRRQVQQFLRERREAGLRTLKWEVKLRHLRRLAEWG